MKGKCKQDALYTELGELLQSATVKHCSAFRVESLYNSIIQPAAEYRTSEQQRRKGRKKSPAQNNNMSIYSRINNATSRPMSRIPDGHYTKYGIISTSCSKICERRTVELLVGNWERQWETPTTVELFTQICSARYIIHTKMFWGNFLKRFRFLLNSNINHFWVD